MMEWIASIPVWLLCLLIFGLRVCDVTLGTVQTVAIVKGYLGVAVALGFFEVLIWILAVSQVIVRINESISLAIAFATGEPDSSVRFTVPPRPPPGRCR